MAKLKKRRYTFRVVRWVREEYSVEIESYATPTMEQVEHQICDPASVSVERQTIQQVEP